MSLEVFDACIIVTIFNVARNSQDYDYDEGVQFCRQGMKLIGQFITFGRSQERFEVNVQSRLSLMGKLYQSENDLNVFVSYIRTIAEFDAFINFMENILKGLFEEGDSTENGLCGPTKITETSVLGIFIRSVMAKWQAMDFAQQCTLFNSYSSLVKNYVSIEYIQQLSMLPLGNTKSSESQRSDGNVTIVDQVETACQNMDTTRAEHLIHQLFDSSPNDPLRRQVRKEFQSLEVYVQELEQAMSSVSSNLPHFSGNSQTRLRSNQTAMITLAILWLRMNNVERAYIAIEEALKTAHHCGDHPSVVRCLLILFHVFSSQKLQLPGKRQAEKAVHSTNQASNLMKYCEEIILRCIARAGLLKMHETVAEAALVFATLKLESLPAATNPFTPNSLPVPTNSGAPTWTFREILRILSYATHGETACTVKYCVNKEAIVVDDTFATSSALTMQQQQQQQKNNAWPVSEELTKNNDTYANFALRCACVQAEVWHKQYLGDTPHTEDPANGSVHDTEQAMSVFVLARALHLHQARAHVEVVTMCLVKKLIFEIDSILKPFIMSSNSQQGQRSSVMASLIPLLRKYRTIQTQLCPDTDQQLPSSTSFACPSKYTQCMLHTAVTILAFFCAVGQNDWSRALRLAEKILDLHLSTPISAFSLPLVDNLNTVRFHLWRQIAHHQCLLPPSTTTYDCEKRAMILSQLEIDLFATEEMHGYRYLMDENSAKFLCLG